MEMNRVPPATPSTTDPIEEAKGTAWLSYLWILWLVPMLTLPNNPFAKFHVKQGIVFTLAWIALSVAGSIIPFLGWFVIAVGSVILFVLMVVGIVKAAAGESWKAPLGLGKLAQDWFKF